MRNVFFTLLCILGFATISYAQPANPVPGKCYVRCITPDVWEDKEVTVLVKPAHKKLEAVPAEYKTVEKQVMIKPASKKYVYVSAEYKTVTEEMRVEDVYNEVSIKAASFAAGTEEIVAKPAYASFEYQRAMANCKSNDPRDCMTLCYVEHPEEKRAVAIETLANDASYTAAEKGGKVITVTKQEEVSPARVDEIEIPAVYETIEVRELVSDETVREVAVEAVYRTETVRVLKEKGGIEVWEEIDCELTDYNVLPIFYELGSARLTSASRKVIDDKLYKLMKEKSNVRIEISSHTDSRGSSASNQDLSQRRAQSVVNYLVSKGINRSRLVAQGYGETRLVNGCKDGVECSEADHQKNRRTEFRVIE